MRRRTLRYDSQSVSRTLMPGLIDMHWHSAYANIAMQVGLDCDHVYTAS